MTKLVEAWVKAHGEAVKLDTAAELMGVSRSTMWRVVAEKKVKVTPQKRVLIRSLCEYANGVGQ